jgi:hypothetical protein
VWTKILEILASERVNMLRRMIIYRNNWKIHQVSGVQKLVKVKCKGKEKCVDSFLTFFSRVSQFMCSPSGHAL